MKEAVMGRKAGVVLTSPVIELKVKAKSQYQPADHVGQFCPPEEQQEQVALKDLSAVVQLEYIQENVPEEQQLLLRETELQELKLSLSTQKWNIIWYTSQQVLCVPRQRRMLIEEEVRERMVAQPLAVMPLGSQTLQEAEEQMLGALRLLQEAEAVCTIGIKSQEVVVVVWNMVHPPDVAQACALAQTLTYTLRLLGLELVAVAQKLSLSLLPRKLYTLYMVIYWLVLLVWHVTGLRRSLPMTPVSTTQQLVFAKVVKVRLAGNLTAMTMVEGSEAPMAMDWAVCVLIETQCQDTELGVRSITSALSMVNRVQVSVRRLFVVQVRSTEQVQRVQLGCLSICNLQALLRWCFCLSCPKL